MKSISAVIAAYNGEQYLERAVDSLVATRYPNLEIIIVDDGSTDGTWNSASQLAESHRGLVKAYFHHDHANRGVSATRNLGIERSSGDLVCFLDADDYVYPHRFDSAVRTLGERPEVDGVYDLCELAFQDEPSRRLWPTGQRFFGFTQAIPSEQLLFALLRGRCWATSAIVVRRSLLEKTGGFDPRLSIAEDCHLWFRMASTGHLMAGDLSRPVSVYWRRPGSAYQYEPRQRLHMVQAMCLFRRWLRKHGGGEPLLRAVESSVSEYILSGVVHARERRDYDFARTLALESARLFPWVMLQRRYWGNLWRSAVES